MAHKNKAPDGDAELGLSLVVKKTSLFTAICWGSISNCPKVMTFFKWILSKKNLHYENILPKSSSCVLTSESLIIFHSIEGRFSTVNIGNNCDLVSVVAGEKELMKMWNLHVMKYGFVGDCQIPLACQMFVQQKGKELLLKNLYRNFVLHLTSLFDFGLISAVCLYTSLQKLQQMVGETQAIRNVLKHAREAQMNSFNLQKSNPLLSPHVHDKQSVLAAKTTPQTGRKTGGNMLLQRRLKRCPTPENLPARRKSVCVDGVPTKKRLSLSLAKNS